MSLNREKRNKLFKASILAMSLFCSSPLTFSSELHKQDKCSKATEGFDSLQKQLFETKFNETDTLKSLESEKRKLLAKKSILETLKKLQQDRENFHKKLNPLSNDSFFNSTTSIKENYKDIQKQIIANKILATVGSSLNLLTKDPSFLVSLNEELSKFSLNKNKKLQIPISDKKISYSSILNTCRKMKSDGIQTEPQARGCAVYENYSKGKKEEGFFTNGQDFVEDVTNNFFKAIRDSGAKVEDADFVKHLKEIKKDSILDLISEDDIEEIGKENIKLKEATTHLKYLRKDELNENERTITSENFTEDKEILELDKDYAALKDCLAKSAFIKGSIDSCSSQDPANKNLKSFVSKMLDISEENNSEVEDAVKKAANEMKDYYKGVDKEKDHQVFSNKNIKINLNALKKLGHNNELGKQLKEVCSNENFDEAITFEELNNEKNKEEFWKCSQALAKSEQNSDQKIADLSKQIDSQNKKIDAYKANPNFKEINDITKYAAFLANRECNFKKGEVNQDFIKSCGNGSDSFVALTLGKKSFITNLDKLDWELTGKGQAEKFLAPLSGTCNKRNNLLERDKKALTQISQEENQSQFDALASTIKEKEVIKNVCSDVIRDYNEILSKTPNPAVVQSHRDYTFKYNSRTQKMDRTERSSWVSKIGASAGRSALNNGLPLLLGNMTFKNTLPYTTEMAIQTKNQMYFLNNPEYMFSGSYFSGYGLTSSPTYYGAPSYYGF